MIIVNFFAFELEPLLKVAVITQHVYLYAAR